MKKTSLLLLILVIGTATTILSVALFQNNRILQVEKFPMQVNVIADNRLVGINVDPGFYFGSLGRGGGSRRQLIINNVEEDLKVHITKQGSMASWVGHPNDFTVRKGEDITIDFSINIPHNALLGNYTGEVTVTLLKI